LGCGDEPRPGDGEASVALTSAEHQLARGLFAANCALCHGDQGDGNGVRRAGFARPPRDLTNPVWSRSTTTETVRGIIRHGRHGTPMPGFAALSDDEIDRLARYVLWLGRRSQLDLGPAGPRRPPG
jgi:mono/diheme cytochrome c family protein